MPMLEDRTLARVERAKRIHAERIAAGLQPDWGLCCHLARQQESEPRLAAAPAVDPPAGGSGAPTLSEAIGIAEKAAQLAASHPELWKAATAAVAAAAASAPPSGAAPVAATMAESDEVMLARVGIDLAPHRGRNLLERIMNALEARGVTSLEDRHAQASAALAAARHSSRVHLLRGGSAA